MGLNIIITGSTGMVGKGVLLECLDHPSIERVLVVNRETVHVQHDKLQEVIVPDFFNMEDIKTQFKGYDICFFCAGTTAVGKSEELYYKITYELTIHFAKTFKEQNPDSMFCYVSGTGTDEKSRIMWARVKGKTENTLLNMGFKAAYMFRPGYIQPLKSIRSKTKVYDLLYTVFSPIYGILKHFPGAATNTSNVGKAMINVVEKGYKNTILGNRDINILAKME